MDTKTPKLDLKTIDNITTEKAFINWSNYTKVYKNDINNLIKDNSCNCSTTGTNKLKITKIEKIYPKLHDEDIVY